MKIGLLDLYTSGHHLPYANRIKRALEKVSDHEITFLTLSETERCDAFFASDEIEYIDSPESPPLEEREEDFADIADTTIERFFAGEIADRYDVIHVLYADDILGPIWRHSRDAGNVRLFGELNGVFFHRGTVLRREYLHPVFLRVLRSPVGRVVDFAVPERTEHEALWQDLYLYRCLNEGVFDSLVVHSEEAKNYLAQLDTRGTNAIPQVPYPSPERFGHDISRDEARDRLELPLGDSLLLFFGVMKNEKGIDLLLDALRRYRGPPFRMHFAGPPVDVGALELERIESSSPVDISYELEFIDSPELYFRAADAVVLPYRRKYGRERASQLFEEVCGSIRPVIVPNYGTLGRITEQWNLGVTFEQGSAESLSTALTTFASDGISFSADRMREYSSHHSYEQVAAELFSIYSDSRVARSSRGNT